MAKDIENYIESLQNFSDAIDNLSKSLLETVKAKSGSTPDETIIGENSPLYSKLSEIAESMVTVQETTEKTKTNTDTILAEVKAMRQAKEKGFFERLSGQEKTKSMADGIKSIALMAGGILAMGLAFNVVSGVDFDSVIALSIAMPIVAYSISKIGETGSKPNDYLSIALSMVIISSGLAASGWILNKMSEIQSEKLTTFLGVATGLGIATYALGNAIKGMKTKDILNIAGLSLVMPVIAGSLVASGWLLQGLPTMSFDTVLDALYVSLAISAAIVPLGVANMIIGRTSIDDFIEMSIIMPIVALSLVGTGHILQGLNGVELPNLLDMLEYSLAIGASLVIMGGAIKLLDIMKVTPIMAIKGALSMTIVAAGLMATSHILSFGDYENYPSLDWALGVGASLLATMPTVLAYGLVAATGIGIVIIGAGILSMMTVAKGLVDVSHILTQGDYGNYPNLDWAMGVGLSLAAFGMASIGLGSFITGTLGLGAVAIDAGLGAVVSIAYTMNEVGNIISRGNYSGGPTTEWGQGVGAAISAFAYALSVFKPGAKDAIMSFFGVKSQTPSENMQMILDIAQLMPDVAEIVRGGNYSGGPDKRWAEGVGLGIQTFATALSVFKPGAKDAVMGFFGAKIQSGDDNIQMILDIAQLMPDVAEIISAGNYSGNVPTEEWAEGVGLGIGTFASALSNFSGGIFGAIGTLFGGGNEGKIDQMLELVKVIPEVATELNKGVYDVYPSEEWIMNSALLFKEFGKIGNIEDIFSDNAITSVGLMSSALIQMATSLNILSASINGLGDTTKLHDVYAGLLLVSAIDHNALKTTMELVGTKVESDNKWTDFTNRAMDSVVGLGKNVFNLFSGNKELPNKKQGNINNENSEINEENEEEFTIVTPLEKQSELLEQLIALMEENNEMLGNISGNTRGKIESGFK